MIVDTNFSHANHAQTLALGPENKPVTDAAHLRFWRKIDRSKDIGHPMRTPVYSDHQIIEAGKALRRQFPSREVTPSAIRTRLSGGNTNRIRDIWNDYSARFAAAFSMQPRDASLTASEAEQALDDTLVVVTDQLRDVVLGLAGALATGRGTKMVSPSSMDGENGLIGRMAATIEAQATEIKTLRQALQDRDSKAGD